MKESVVLDPRYQSLVKKYQCNWELASKDLFGLSLSVPELEILRRIQKEGAFALDETLSSTDSDLPAIIALLYVMLCPGAQCFFISRKNPEQLFISMEMIYPTLCKNHPWISTYFTLSDNMFYAQKEPHLWHIRTMKYNDGDEERLAGWCNRHLMWIVEKPGVLDRAMAVIDGGLTEADSRLFTYFYKNETELSTVATPKRYTMSEIEC